MPGISRNGQDVAGGVAIEGSSNVSVNSKGVVRLGDKVASHGIPPHAPTPPMNSSSSTVKVNSNMLFLNAPICLRKPEVAVRILSRPFLVSPDC